MGVFWCSDVMPIEMVSCRFRWLKFWRIQKDVWELSNFVCVVCWRDIVLPITSDTTCGQPHANDLHPHCLTPIQVRTVLHWKKVLLNMRTMRSLHSTIARTLTKYILIFFSRYYNLFTLECSQSNSFLMRCCSARSFEFFFIMIIYTIDLSILYKRLRSESFIRAPHETTE